MAARHERFEAAYTCEKEAKVIGYKVLMESSLIPKCMIVCRPQVNKYSADGQQRQVECTGGW